MPPRSEERTAARGTDPDHRRRMARPGRQHPFWTRVRPTRAMVRQSVYDILGTRVVGARMLDLYAGAGTVGFGRCLGERPLSTFVERHREALALIARTAERFGCRDRCSLVGADVRRWLRGASEQTMAADLCYVDAPYRDPELESVLELLGAAHRVLSCANITAPAKFPSRSATSHGSARRVTGLTTISFLQRNAAPSDGTA